MRKRLRDKPYKKAKAMGKARLRQVESFLYGSGKKVRMTDDPGICVRHPKARKK